MRNATETVSNLRNQISEAGENIMDRVRRRGRQLPNSDNDIIENIEGRMRWDNEMRQNEQNRNAANRLTAAIKRKRKENTIENIEGRMRWDNEMKQNEQNRNAANRLTAAIKREKEENTIGFKKIENENDR
jgi:hypothetical protein